MKEDKKRGEEQTKTERGDAKALSSHISK